MSHTKTVPNMINESQIMNIEILLSKSYSVYFFAFIFGLFLDAIFSLSFNNKVLGIVGISLLVFATLLVYWAQKVNSKPVYLSNGNRDFTLGPYKYSRNPTQTGIFLIQLGAGLAMGSYFVIVGAILALLYSTKVVIKKEENRHIKKYGQVYLDYMKKVRRII